VKGQFWQLAILASAALLPAPLVAFGLNADQKQDEGDIRKVVVGLQEAWNRHDMKTWASLFAKDADFVNVAGWLWKGRDEIQSKHEQAHAFMFRESTLTMDEPVVRFLATDIALVHVTCSLVGDKNPDGTPRQPRKAILTLVLQRQEGTWLIAAAQNTDRRPEAPIPTAPPSK